MTIVDSFSEKKNRLKITKKSRARLNGKCKGLYLGGVDLSGFRNKHPGNLTSILFARKFFV